MRSQGQKGGRREGAGRPRNDLKHKDVIARLEEQITAEMPGLVDVLVKLAKGVLVERTGENGEPEVYKEKPDRDSAKYLIDRIAGKPEQRVRNRHSGSLTLISRAMQMETLADPEVLGLLCELDTRLSAAPYPESNDCGEMGQLDFRGEMDMPPTSGSPEPSPNGNGCGPH